MTSLFRPEAVEQQRQQWLGGVRLVRPLSLTLLTAAVMASAVAVGAWLFFGEYTRKAQVGGVIVPDRGLIRLVPPVSGTVVERRVAEGQTVHAGDVLFVIALERTTLDSGSQAKVQASLDERRRSLQEATRQQAALSLAEQDILTRRLRDMKRELDQIDAEAELQRQRVALAQQALARVESLRAENFISPAQVQAKSEELLALQTQVQGLERQRASLTRERAAAEGELRSMPMRERGRQGEIERDQATLTREAAEYESARRVQVRAPHDGTVSALAVETGQAVTPSGALASLVPAGAQLQAHLFAPSGAMGFIQPDQAVRLRLQAFPYQKYGALQGRVLQVSRTPLGPNELSSLTAAGPAAAVPGEALFRITVALDADPAAHGWTQPLVPGLRLDADVMLERRRLVEWLFAPVLGLAQRAG